MAPRWPTSPKLKDGIDPEGLEGVLATDGEVVVGLPPSTAGQVLRASGSPPEPGWGAVEVGDVDGLQPWLDGVNSALTTLSTEWQPRSEKGQPNGYASLDGTGKVPSAQLPDVGGGADWGDIGGTLSDQTDLQEALDGKADTSHTHSATDITSGTLPISRGGTDSTTAASARTSLDVPSRASEYTGSATRYLWFSTTSGASPQYRTNVYAEGSTLNAGSFSSPSSGSSEAYFSSSLGLVVLGPGLWVNGGFLQTLGGSISTGSGNIQGASGCQIGWTSSANSPTGSGTNCHINGSGNLVRQTSQGKLKEDQAPLETTIDEIMAWQPKSFRWVEEMGGHEDIGLIAEEVSAIDPRAAWHDHDQVLQGSEEPADPEDPDSETVEVQRYACCPEQPVVPLGVHYERAWVHLLAATQDFYRRYQEERTELLARIEALEGGVQ